MSFEAAFHVELHYHVLSHLDLGRDAASIYRARDREPAWLAAARAGYEGLATQVRPLRVPDLNALCAASPDAWTEALRAASHEVAWPPPERDLVAIEAPLARIYEALWALAERAPPPLRVLDTPALGRHGRATMLGAVQVVAVSLEDPGHALCQIAHEACHAVTDPTVVARVGSARDTRPGHAGFEVHQAVEAVAIEVVRDVVAEVAPHWTGRYASWCARFGR